MARRVEPNFFIIGAPKCGTTTIADWIRGHPDAFMPPQKEPHHFNKDHNFVVYPDFEEYLELFASASNKIAIGEASVFYLLSEVAVPLIESTFSHSRYIVCVRNPIDMAVSLHKEERFATNEHVADFFSAWKLSPDRRRGRSVSIWCREPQHLDYQVVCSLGAQVQRLLRVVPNDRVHFVTLDEMASDPSKVYRGVLAFLGLKDDGKNVFQASNQAKAVRWPAIKRLVRILGYVRRSLPIRARLGILNGINRVNATAPGEEGALSPEQRAEMLEYYRDDINLLASLTGRDLSNWLK